MNILKEALQKNPKNFVALNNLAAAYSNLGDFVNAKIYAEVVGYGANCDAHHITAPTEDGRGAAKCMQTAMGDLGKIYRIGGDEFAVIIEAPNAEAVCKVSLMQFNVNLHNHNMYYANDYDVTVAHGESFYRENKNITLSDIIKEADKNMYKNKKEMKEKNT